MCTKFEGDRVTGRTWAVITRTVCKTNVILGNKIKKKKKKKKKKEEYECRIRTKTQSIDLLVDTKKGIGIL